MKFFGWGRKKGPPPIPPAHFVFKNSGAGRSIQSPEAAKYRSDQLDGQEAQPLVTPSQRVAFPLLSKDFFEEAGVDVDLETWEERLLETIRFVFSHQQEGLLAIWTFAIDQVAGVTHINDGQKPPAATDHHKVNCLRNSVSSMQVMIRESRSSDDEIESQHSMRSPIPACKSCIPHLVTTTYPARVFTTEASPSPAQTQSQPKITPYCTSSANANASTHEVGIEPRGDTRGPVDPSTTLGHDQFGLEDFYPPRVCGLFASRSRRTQKGGGKEKQKKAPEKRKGNSRGSLGAQLGRLLRSSCTSSAVSAQVSPEYKPILCPLADHRESQAQGPPCIANFEEGGAGAPSIWKPFQASEVGEQRKRKGHSFGKG